MDLGGDFLILSSCLQYVISTWQGYNVCIFAYGQTGSGKTHTMTGTNEDPGLNTRVLRELFRIRDERKNEYEIQISFLVQFKTKRWMFFFWFLLKLNHFPFFFGFIILRRTTVYSMVCVNTEYWKSDCSCTFCKIEISLATKLVLSVSGISITEIYNESIRDLLNPEGKETSTSERRISMLQFLG